MAFPKSTEDKEKKIKGSRVKYVVILVVLIIVALLILIFALWAKGGIDLGGDDDETNLYSASRFFCRVKYPDNWEVSSDANGFYLNKENGLIFQLYPFTTQEVEVELEEGETMPPTTPAPIKNQTEGVLVSVYYHESPEFSWPEESAEDENENQKNQDDLTAATPEPTASPAPYDLNKASQSAVDILKSKIIPGNGGHDIEISEGTDKTAKNCSMKVYTYKYTNSKGQLIRGEMDVCTRSMAYYMITYEAVDNLYGTFENSFKDMANDFVLSVFDY